MALVDLGERMLELERTFELVSFPLLIDTPREELEALPDGDIDVALVTGAVRTSEDAELVRLLRRTSRRLVAFGACAQLGSLLALADLVPVETLLATVYGTPAPGEISCTGDGGLGPPSLTRRVRPLSELAVVDYSIPGCPPERQTLAHALDQLTHLAMADDPPSGANTVLAPPVVSVCEECPRGEPTGGVTSLARAHTCRPDDPRCLLDHGLACVGPATRGGCGAPCPTFGEACHGCYGPPPGAHDQGARALGALAAELGVGNRDADEAALRQAVESCLDGLADPVGTLYRYSLASSLLSSLGGSQGGQECDD